MLFSLIISRPRSPLKFCNWCSQVETKQQIKVFLKNKTCKNNLLWCFSDTSYERDLVLTHSEEPLMSFHFPLSRSL